MSYWRLFTNSTQNWNSSTTKFTSVLQKMGSRIILCIFRPQKNSIRIDAKLERSDAIEQKIAASGLEVMDYDSRWSRYRIRLGKGDVIKHEAILRELFLAAYGDVPEEQA